MKRENYWTEEEIEILRKYASKCHYTELVKVLPNRSVEAISLKAHLLGIELITNIHRLNDETANYIKQNWGKISIRELSRKLKVSPKVIYRYKKELNLPDIEKKKKWDEKNIEKLRELSKTMTIDELAKYFKTTKGIITTIAYREDIVLIDSKIIWTKEKIELLKELSEYSDAEEIGRILNMPVASIRSCAKRNSIKLLKSKRKNDNNWIKEEIDELINLVNQDKDLIEIINIMDKDDKSIMNKAKELGLNIMMMPRRDWTKEEIEQLIICSKTMKMDELVKKFGRTSSSIKSQAKKHNITIMYNRKTWTKEEEKILEKLVLIDKKGYQEIAGILDRTEDSIVVKMKRMKLPIQGDKRIWTKEEEELLMDLWGTTSIEKIADKLNRTVSSIKNKAFDIGLGSALNNNYDGLRIQEISEIFNISRNIIDGYWLPLGLKFKTRKLSEKSSYKYVEIKDLFEFLEVNQNIWDSRNLEPGILGKEPNWLLEKRKRDINKPEIIQLEFMKQSLILANKYYLNEEEITEEKGFQKVL